MSKNKPVPPAVLARLHGKGSMSEILNIERERLRQQSEQAMEQQFIDRVQPTGQPTVQLTRPITELPTNLPTSPGTAPARRVTEGLSQRSRFVGETLTDYNDLIIHQNLQLDLLPPVPPELERLYRERVFASLPFSSQRDLLSTICRLTLGYRKSACQITLAQLARVSGIRNVKTLRKWLNDLTERGLIRYTPIHGDPRGPLIAIIPLEGI